MNFEQQFLNFLVTMNDVAEQCGFSSNIILLLQLFTKNIYIAADFEVQQLVRVIIYLTALKCQILDSNQACSFYLIWCSTYRSLAFNNTF